MPSHLILLLLNKLRSGELFNLFRVYQFYSYFLQFLSSIPNISLLIQLIRPLVTPMKAKPWGGDLLCGVGDAVAFGRRSKKWSFSAASSDGDGVGRPHPTPPTSVVDNI